MNYKLIVLLSIFTVLTACDQITYAGVFEIEALDDNSVRICATRYNVNDDLSGIVRIPERIYGKKVVEIGERTFKNCKKVRGFIIPGTITTIGSYAFDDCTSLTSVVFEYPYGWKVGSHNLSLTDPQQNANYLKDTYKSYTWQRQ